MFFSYKKFFRIAGEGREVSARKTPHCGLLLHDPSGDLNKQFAVRSKKKCLGEIRNVINSGDSFSFDKNPSAKKRVDSMLKTLQGNLTNTVSQYSQTVGRVATQTAKDGVKASVSPSKKEQDFVDKLSDDAMKNARKSASESAGEAKMSSSVWNFDDYSKKEIQAIINAGIRKGLTVQGIADSVAPYLNNPLLEDAEPEFQKIQTPKGVYKSAYKNALRLARTEVMRAYDEAEWNSYQNDPMVVGFEVKTSNNHTVLIHGKRVPLKDMCDQLAGKYPKSFKFTGWHPQCRCTMLPITIGTSELGDLMEAQENGEEFVSKNTVSELPEGFTKWYEANKDRFNANNEPWFLDENKDIIETDGDYSEPLLRDLVVDAGNTEKIKFESFTVADEESNNEYYHTCMEMDIENIKYNEVTKFKFDISEKEIINRLCVTDDARASCASLAHAYMGCKLGYDVIDSRGGKSRLVMAKSSREICLTMGTMFSGKDANKVSESAFESIKEGEEAIMSAGRHCAIVRKVNGSMQVLELQGRPQNNGFLELTTQKLQTRFRYVPLDEKNSVICILTKENIIKNLSSYLKMLGYINTPKK